MKKVIYARNEFLNKPSHHSVAAVSISVTTDGKVIEGGISISDCTRVIHLDISTYYEMFSHTPFMIDVEETLDLYDNSIHKANILIDVFGELANALENYRNEFEKSLVARNDKERDKKDE